VVPNLSRIVVDTSAGFFNDLFKRHALKFGAFLKIVQIDHISVVVLSMVKLKSFLGVMRGQSIHGVGQSGQLMFHKFLLIVLKN